MTREPAVIDRKKNQRVGLVAGAVALSMIGLAFASAPLYRLICQVTGFGGTIQRADAAPTGATGKMITVRFDSNTSPDLPWQFHAEQTIMQVKLGEQALAHYRATNKSQAPTIGSATYNVTPEIAGAYFNKLQCFCFTEQTLKPGESIDMPVVFYVDPAIADNPDTSSISEITLSYTFYPKQPAGSGSAAQQAPSLSN
jgi:cytochrome c oxidase assembly protein subunit 11